MILSERKGRAAELFSSCLQKELSLERQRGAKGPLQFAWSALFNRRWRVLPAASGCQIFLTWEHQLHSHAGSSLEPSLEVP